MELTKQQWVSDILACGGGYRAPLKCREYVSNLMKELGFKVGWERLYATRFNEPGWPNKANARTIRIDWQDQ